MLSTARKSGSVYVALGLRKRKVMGVKEPLGRKTLAPGQPLGTDENRLR